MKLLWSARSPFVRKVMIVAHETGTLDRIEIAAMAIAQPKINDAILAQNPIGKIPVLLREDGAPLVDSRVICEYLDSLSGSPALFPAAGEGRWAALRWQALGDGLLEQVLAWRNEGLRPDGERSDAFRDSYARRSIAGLDRLEAEAADLAAAGFTIGHVAIGCLLGFLDFRFADLGWREGRPALAAWYADFAARPSTLTYPADPDA